MNRGLKNGVRKPFPPTGNELGDTKNIIISTTDPSLVTPVNVGDVWGSYT